MLENYCYNLQQSDYVLIYFIDLLHCSVYCFTQEFLNPKRTKLFNRYQPVWTNSVYSQMQHIFIHYCLGACERTHHTLSSKLTPYMNDKCNNWDTMVHSVVFSMNHSVNTSNGYSPFEIIYGQRPKFPLTGNVKDSSPFQLIYSHI